MKKTMIYTATALLGAAYLSSMTVCAEETVYPVTVKDDFGTEVTLEKAPESIVSLAPVDTEILFAIGAGDVVTGRTEYCNYPEEAAEVETIGTYAEPNMELILSKTPDLVVASGYLDDSIRQQLEENGAVVFITNANNLESVKYDIETLGTLINRDEEAADLIESMDGEWQELSEKLDTVSETKSAFIDIGSLYSAGPSSLLDETLKLLKVTNIAGEADSAWPQLSAETIVAAEPDVYISLYPQLDEVKEIAGLGDLECLNEEGGFIYIDGASVEGDMIQRPGPRYVEGLKALAELIYPELAE